MYKSFYSLNKKPFQISTDPSFIWLGENHKEALARLKYGILDNKEFLLLTGDVGTGKTTLINSLTSNLTDKVIYASVLDPSLEKLDFLNHIAELVDINQEFTSKGKFVSAFSRFLREAYDQNKSVLLIIDEAQLLTQEILEEVRLLSNINIDNSTILSIFFVGQNEFNEVISRPENRAVCNRLTLNYNLSSLDQEQTREYISHRLKVAGTTREIFAPSAIRAIYDYSDGVPRRINVVCDHCLITGYVAGKKVIDDKDVLDCTSDLYIPSYANSVSYQNREELLASDLYIPPKELFKSEYQDGPGNQYLTEQYTQNDDSVEIEKISDQAQRFTKRVWFIWTSVIFFCVIGFIFLYQLLPDSISETFNTSMSQQSSFTTENKLIVPKLAEKPAIPRTIYTEKLPSANAEIELSSKISTETEDVISTTSIEESAESNIPQETLEAKETISLISHNEDSGYYSDEFEENRRTISVPDSIKLSKKFQHYDSPIEQDEYILHQPDQLLIFRFNLNSLLFKSLDYELIENYVDYLKGSPVSEAIIAGHTDSSGSFGYNNLISKYRAEIVKSYFTGRGVPDSQLKVIGFGPRKPLAENDTKEGRELNRRVEVSILPEE